MGQVLHGSATTTAAIRRAIHHSQESLMWTAERGASGIYGSCKILLSSRFIADQRCERSDQLRPYVRPVARRLPLAIMGVRLRVRHQSKGRARSTNSLPVLPELS